MSRLAEPAIPSLFILGLSLTALDILATTDVRVQDEEKPK